MDRRRMELQLRMLRTLLQAEQRRGDPEALADFVERASPIVGAMARTIEAQADPELLDLLDTLRAEMKGASRP